MTDFETQKQAVVKTLQQYFNNYRKNNLDVESLNNFNISNADLKSIGEQMSKSFEYTEKIGKKKVTTKK